MTVAVMRLKRASSIGSYYIESPGLNLSQSVQPAYLSCQFRKQNEAAHFPVHQAERKAGYMIPPLLVKLETKTEKRLYLVNYQARNAVGAIALPLATVSRQLRTSTEYLLWLRKKSAAHVTLAEIRKAPPIHIFYPRLPEHSLSSILVFMTIDLQADFLASRYEPLYQ